MTEVTKQRDTLAKWAKSMFDRCLTGGASGNISLRLSDGTLLVTPTGSSMSFLDPGRISHLDETGHLLSGEAPTKEMPLHSAFYETCTGTGAVVHLHSSHTVALSVLPDINPDNVLPPLTAYSIMRLGKVKLLPFFLPGDQEMGDAVRGLAGERSAVLLAHHGPVVAGKDLEAAVYAMEELEETAKLTLLTQGLSPRVLDDTQIAAVVQKFDVQWD
ncbi:aldolase [Sedimentitalea sp. CY04]|uniref:3-oxo-tetronate 4-phosphate decarboxylase n=1 Tax=Parasedimentitalea denitrificans TaxID=2211118 RepID=A0ABX0WGD3_9RHOB|nr:3-oxo-tetronate 4-phosphate decarboxylase [Sedimentitalea sp. CY04]NIZ63420.1 aldolase [Sedimentitalea sp. CY04]